MAKKTVIKCKYCNADIVVEDDASGVAQCAFCLEYNTLPKKETEPKAIMLIRSAELLLYSCDFDKAYDAYYKASQADSREPEAYFGMALSEHKVQYIKDEVEGRYRPICYELTDKEFARNSNYLRALELSTPKQRARYENQAHEIDDIRREFIRIKKSGLRFDCFICSKVSADGGKKTADNETANDIYHHLRDKGFKPFYSEREMQNRSGVNYEALILYALHESKCMILVCSDEKYLLTPWVKNEYTRYIKMMNDEEKASDSITIAFGGTPIETLPGKKGKIQGVDTSKMDAMSRLETFVRNHVSAEKKPGLKYCIECGYACAPDVSFCPKCGKSEFASSAEKARGALIERKDSELRKLSEEKKKAEQLAEKEKSKREKAQKRTKGNARIEAYAYDDDGEKSSRAVAGKFATACTFAVVGFTALIVLQILGAIFYSSLYLILQKVGFYASIAFVVIILIAHFAGRSRRGRPPIAGRKYNAGIVLVAVAGLLTVGMSIYTLSIGSLSVEDYYVSNSGVVYAEKKAEYTVWKIKNGHEDVVVEGSIDGMRVTKVRSFAAGNNSNMISLAFNGGDMEISNSAFKNCKRLESVTMGNSSVYTVGKNAFSGCPRLKTVILGDNSTYTIKKNAFNKCASLELFDVGSSVVTVNTELNVNCDDRIFGGSTKATLRIDGGSIAYLADSLGEVVVGSNSKVEIYSWYVRSGKDVNLKVGRAVFNEGFDFTGSSAVLALIKDKFILGEKFMYYSFADVIYLPSSITYIPDCFFGDSGSGCKVYYAGTKAEWDNLTVGSSGNSNYTGGKVTVEYNSSFGGQ